MSLLSVMFLFCLHILFHFKMAVKSNEIVGGKLGDKGKGGGGRRVGKTHHLLGR